MSESDQLLTADEVCAYLRVSKQTLYRRVADGSVPAFRLGDTGTLRFPPDAAERLLKRAVPDHEGDS